MSVNKYQNVDFRDIDELLEFLPEQERKLVSALRSLILRCIPECQETLSYNIPIYKRHGCICFIWPSSVPWGGMQVQGVRLGFNYGNLLSDEIGYLDKGNRKQVYCKDFGRIQEIDIDLLSSYLYEAAIVDEEKAKARKRKKKA